MTVDMQYFSPLEELITKYLPKSEIDKVREAYEFAYKGHLGQFRSSGEPYITHPVAVSCILAEMELDFQAVISALLHDTIEDTQITYEDVVDKFGKDVAELVEGVSKLDKLKFRNRQEAQVENFRKMVLAMVKDVRVILIKLADRTHNMRTLGSLRPDKRRRIAKETLEIYAPLAYRLGIYNIKKELEILGFTAMHPNRAKVIEKVIDSARHTRKSLIQQILTDLNERLIKIGIEATVEGIEKNIYAIYQKMRLHEQKFRSIMDIYIFRIIVKDIDNCYRALGVVHNFYKPRVNRFKDYIAIPKANGYQSLHSSLIGPHGTPVEIQIRTNEMNQMAQMGIIAHSNNHHINELKESTTQIKAQRWMKNLLELQQSVGNSFEFIENVKSDLFPKEIYVFTPKGRIIELPEGATPVDFAYAVHTDIGHQCTGAIVDRKHYPLSQPLSNGQTVDISIKKGSRPNAGWLNFVVSAKARSRIRQALKNLERDDAITLGKQLLDYALLEQGGIQGISQEKIDKFVKFVKLPSFDDLLAEIGLGNIISQFVVKSIEHSDQISDKKFDHEKRLTLTGTEGLLITFSKCCHPIPDDPIIGRLNPEKGLSVHHESCRNIIGYQTHPDKFIPLAWSALENKNLVAEIWIDIINNTATALANIISTINAESAEVEWLNTEEKDDRIYNVMLHIKVKNSIQLNEIIRKIGLQQDVVNITRNIN